MAIPFFSIDLKFKDILELIKNISLPTNKKKSYNKLQEILDKRFPDKNVILLPSARLGFYLSLKKFFKENDEVIFSVMSFPLYVKIANELKLKVKLVDVSENDLNIDVDKLNKSITENTKGIVITHLFGYPCEIDKIKDLLKGKNIKLIEDCAQSFGTYYNNTETGNFGDVGIFSCSLVKIPTTLGGGILITSDTDLKNFIETWLSENLPKSLIRDISYGIKNLISVANSYPFIYSILSSKILFFLNRFNPRSYRKIVYSGMGLKNKKFDPKERNDLKKYQLEFGVSQLKNYDQSKKIRIENTKYLEKELSGMNSISFLNYKKNIDWNYQYFILRINGDYEEFNKKIFRKGLHAMEENVWDCTNYGYLVDNKDDNFSVGKDYNSKIVRIQNSSYLKKHHLDKIINIIKSSINE
jgi:dTDP-4-amino-4,6-dideoxygalactose transaminase